MQILKESIRESILKAAREVFYENGFMDSSMRAIADKAGITVGNLYRYFKNKEDLFDHVVNPIFTKVAQHIRSHNHKEFEEKDIDLLGALEMQLDLHSSLFKGNRKEFLILFEGSKGTRYESTKEYLIAFNTHHVKETLQDYYKNTTFDPKLIYPLSRAITVSIVEGLYDIFKRNEKDEDIEQVFREYFRSMIIGFGHFYESTVVNKKK
jgi:AcrR family transcriptional regulator